MIIVEKGGEYSKREIYSLTKSPKVQKLSNHVNEIFPVEKYLIYKDGDSEDDMEILSIQAGEDVIATNSSTCIKEFRGILELMEDEAFSVEVLTGTSKNGRTYLTLALA